MRRLHEGDCELFYDLTKGFLPNVYAFVRSMVHDASMTDDICQHTFLIAMQKVHHLRELRCLRSWVMQIAVNQVRMNWRSSQRHPTVSIDALDDSDQPSLLPAKLIDARETPLKAVAHRELKQILDEALHQLAPKYRSVFWLRDIEQFSGAEAAAMLGISINCVKSRLLRARLKLRDHLAPILGMQATPLSCPGPAVREEQTTLYCL
ncbi:MAG TPA: RNA polymerase sigma factor [Terriglobales bacterium]|nr:RNA polymerase sigma factor [Terriglobales bacterium]